MCSVKVCNRSAVRHIFLRQNMSNDQMCFQFVSQAPSLSEKLTRCKMSSLHGLVCCDPIGFVNVLKNECG